MKNIKLEEHEAWVQARSDFYVACAFRGRGQYDRIETKTLAEADEAGRGLCRNKRPVLIYAVRNNRQSLVHTVTA